MTKRIIRCLAVVWIALVLLLAFHEGQAVAGEEVILENENISSVSSDKMGLPLFASQIPNCRLGAYIGSPYWDSADFPLFNFGTYIDFSAQSSAPGPDSMEYWRIIRIHQDRGAQGEYLNGYTINPSWGTLEARVKANPGVLWIVGNEPDRDDIQDDTFPSMYARAYHDVYAFIKGLDPTARVAVAGLVGFTPGREQYLDIVWDTYMREYGTGMPADAWTIHPYVLWESGGAGAHIALGTDPALAIPYSSDCADPNSICFAENDSIQLVAEQIVRMRQWMQRHGQQNKPLMVTEWGVQLPYKWEDGSLFYDENGNTFNPQRVSSFLTNTLNHYQETKDTGIGYPMDEYRLVQQWIWYPFTIVDVLASSSSLVEPAYPYTTTFVGETWKQYAGTISPYIDLKVDTYVHTAISVTNILALTANVYNVGNARTDTPITITFYSDAALEKPFFTQTLSSLSGCTWGETVSATWEKDWQGVQGVYPFWVEITGALGTQLDRDVVQGKVLLNPKQIFLPLIMRNTN